MSGFGSGFYGLSPWGFGAGAPVSIERTLLIAERTVRVWFTGDVQMRSVLAADDALNPLNWSVTRLDTGASLIVLACAAVDERTVDVLTLKVFGPFSVEHRITASSRILTSLGSPVVAPLSDVLFGTSRSLRLDTAVKRPLVDLRNAPTSNDEIAGALVVGSSGDYTLESGAELEKKLIIRRVTTARAAYFHMNDYGSNVRIKSLVLPSDLPRIHREILEDVYKEPSVKAASVALDLSAAGVLTATIKAELKSGVPISMKVGGDNG